MRRDPGPPPAAARRTRALDDFERFALAPPDHGRGPPPLGVGPGPAGLAERLGGGTRPGLGALDWAYSLMAAVM
ncbi:MAG TPA: hypothetical protein VLA43_08825, partial [Longimicrobiales bacterium]|nr:hypothetical protein [Longimicrobiales bacterium]